MSEPHYLTAKMSTVWHDFKFMRDEGNDGRVFLTPVVVVDGSVEVTGGLTQLELGAMTLDVNLTSQDAPLLVSVGNFPSTQSISASSLPLPTGASTAALQTSGNANLTSIDIKVATSEKQDVANDSLSNIDDKLPALVGGFVPVSISGVATSLKQDGMQTTLDSIDSKLGGTITTGLPAEASTSALQASSNTKLDAIISELSGNLFLSQMPVNAVAWFYAAASGGIVSSTTAIQIAAPVSGKRNYIKSLQCSYAPLLSASDLQILDDATVIFRIGLTTLGSAGFCLSFDPPLFSSVNTALNIKVGISVIGTVYVNSQGHYV